MIRREQIEADLTRKIGDIFINDLNDPIFEMVSILRVRLSADKSVANVYFSVLDDENREKVRTALINEMEENLRPILRKRLRIRIG